MTLRNLVLFAAVITIATAQAFEVPSGIRDPNRLKRQTLLGGEELQDPNDAQFKKLALESFEKYRQTSPGGVINVKEIKVTKVTKQVVSGSVTRLTFTVEPTNGEKFTCHSEIWEQPWLNKKDITVNCDINQQKPKVKRQVPGGEVEKDPKDQQYKKLAQESIEKFSKTNPGGPISVKEIKVTKVTYQVVSGSLTRLTFTVEPTNGEKFTCHSKIWEQPWLNKKDITVNCDINQQKPKVKRQVPGGQVEKDPKDQQYKKLAQESIEKFSKTNPGGPISVKEIKVTKVTYQVVSGSLTRLTFTVEPTNGEKFTCHSKIWEQPWLNKKDITVNCDINQQKPKVKRQVPGGQVEKDPKDQQYKKLAQESIEKFSKTNPGGPISVKEIKVTKVTYQVVSGSLTRLTFTVEPTDGEKFTCHSKIWEQPWLNKKDITVNCDFNQQKPKVKRQVPGGQVEKDPKDQQYKKLAQESIEKFSKTNPGGPISVKEIKVTKVTYQVVSGSLTRLTFTVEPTDGEKFTCHSKIWEQPWLNKKDITVNCDMKG